MNASSVRARLLGSAALGLGLSMVAASPAQAACNVVGSDVVCDSNTTTLDSNFPANFPADRNFNFGAGVPELGLEIDAGVTVDGFGLALTDIGAPADATVTIVNNGAIQLNAGNTPTTGATQAALSVSASGSTSVDYLGTGSVTSLGNGNGIDFVMNGTGDLTANIGGNVMSGVGNNNITGVGVYIHHLGTAGDVNVTTAAGTTIRADRVGVFLYGDSATNTGDFTLTNNASILSRSGAPNSLDYGLFVGNDGLGSLTIVNDGQVGNITDRIQNTGVGAYIDNTNSTAAISVSGSGDIFSGFYGIYASNFGSGSVTVDYSGAIDAIGGAGVYAQANNGAVTVDTSAGSITAAGTGIYAESTTGDIDVTSGAITAVAGGILAYSVTGNETINTAGPITAGANGIEANTGGDIEVTGAGDIAAGGFGIYAETTANGAVTIDYDGDVTSSSTGVVAIATSGSVAIDTSAATITAGALGYGIYAESTSGGIDISSGQISAAGDGIDTHSTAGAQTIDINDSITTDASGIHAFSTTGDIGVTGEGDIFAGSDGIYASSANGGAVTVDYSGAITSGAFGIDAAAAGDIDIIGTGDIIAGSAGIYAASSADGAVTVDYDGDVTAGDYGINTRTILGNIGISGSGSITGDAGIRAVVAGGGDGSVEIEFTGMIDAAVADGVEARANVGSGSIIIDTSDGNITAGNFGIHTESNSGSITITSGAIEAVADGIYTISITGTQTINVVGPITAGGHGVEAFSNTGDIGITGIGDIGAGDVGLYVTTGGAGAVTIDYAGPIDAASDGVYVQADAGDVNVALGAVSGGDSAVNLLSTGGGTQTIVLNGVASGATLNGVRSDTTGDRTITIGTAGNVTGVSEDIVFANTGDATIVNSGVIGATPGGTAVNSSATSLVITNNASGIINGTFLLGGTSTVFDNAGTWNVTAGLAPNAGDLALTNSGIANVAGLFDFGNGTDSFANTAAGVVNLVGDTDLANVETFTNAGMLNLATYTLTGPALSFVNDGVVATGGDAGLVGFADFTNAGTVDLAAGTFTVPAGAFVNDGTILANQGLTTIVGQTDFANAGLIDLSNGVAGDVLTIASDFAGSGGSSLLLDVASGVADVLVINGAATGTTTLAVNAVGAPINSDGILVVDTGTSTVDAFVLGSTLGAGLVDFSLVREGEDFFLVSAPNASALEPLALINTGLDMWYQSADIYHGYAALKRSDLGTGRDRPGVWGQVYWGRDRYGDKGHQTLFGNDMVVDHHQRTERHGLQGGVDFSFAGAVMGATVGWQKAVSDIGGSPSKAHSRGVNIGGYMMVGSAKGFYAGLLAKYDHNRVRLDNPAFAGVGKISANSFGMEGELGYRLAIGSGMLNLGGGLAWVSGSVEDFATASIDYDYDRVKSVRGRLGARYEHRSGVYLDGQLFHEFKDHNSLALISGSEADIATSKGRGTWLRAELGYGKSGSAGPTAALWVNAGDTHGIGLKAGWRF